MSAAKTAISKEFSETQRFRQWWVWALLIALNGILVVVVYSGIAAMAAGEPTLDDLPMLIFIALVIVGITVVMLSVRLETRINNVGIYVRMYPLQRTERHYPWHTSNHATFAPINQLKSTVVGVYEVWDRTAR